MGIAKKRNVAVISVTMKSPKSGGQGNVKEKLQPHYKT